MKILLLGEQRQGVLASGLGRLVPPLAQLGPLSLLLTGPGHQQGAGGVSWSGVGEILLAGGEPDHTPNAETLAPWLVGIIRQEGFTHVAAPASSWGRDLLPRVAGLLDLPMVSEVVAILDGQRFQRPVLAGRGLATVQADCSPVLLTLRPSAFPAVPPGEWAPPPRRTLSPLPPATGSHHVAFLPSPIGRPDLATAGIVVAGGQGVGEAQYFQLITALADCLGGAVGASRGAVDAGFAPNDWQIGQTGKVIAPQLYIAAGISGAIQHLAGIQAATTIITINNDPDAPIFAVSDYGLVADLRQAIPEILACLEKGELP